MNHDDLKTAATWARAVCWPVEVADARLGSTATRFMELATPTLVLELLERADRAEAENTAFDDGMRELASSLGAGGYNAETLTAAQLLDKVNWGVNHHLDVSASRIDGLTQERDQFKLQAEALRACLQQFVDGEDDPDENLSARHMQFTEAQTLLAVMKGEVQGHTIVPDAALKRQHDQITMLRAQIEPLKADAQEQRESTLHYCGRVGELMGEVHLLQEAAELHGSGIAVPRVSSFWLSPANIPESGTAAVVLRDAGAVGNAQHAGHRCGRWLERTVSMGNAFACDLMSTGMVIGWVPASDFLGLDDRDALRFRRVLEDFQSSLARFYTADVSSEQGEILQGIDFAITVADDKVGTAL